MRKTILKWILCGLIGLLVAISSGWGQSSSGQQAPPQPAAGDLKAPPNPKKKMKKVHTLFGDTWVEEKDQTPESPAVQEPTPQPKPAENVAGKSSESAPPAAQAPTPVAAPPAAQKQPGATPSAENPGTPTAPAVPTPQAPSTGASLVFNNADLVQVVQVIANLLHLNYILDPAVKGTVTITTMGDISNADLLQILQTLLRINGAAAIQSGNVWQIVPMKNIHQIPVPLEHPGDKPLSPDDQIVTEIIPLEFVSAADMSRILKEFLSDGGSIVSHERGNILIITEASRNMARLLDLIRTLDSDALASQRLRLFSVKNNSPRAVAEDLKTIFGAYAMTDKESAVRFIPIDRLNSLLVVAPNPASFDVVAQWIDKLDQPAQVAGLRNYVYRVQYAKASDLRSMLTQLYGSAITSSITLSNKPEEGNAGAVAPTGNLGLAPSTLLTPPPTKPETQGVPKEAFGLQGSIRVVADTVNNLLIIQAEPQDYDVIEQTLEEIDILPREVLIEAQIFSVDLSNSYSMGVEYTLQQRGTTTTGSKPLGSLLNGNFTGSSIILRAGARELLATLTATENRNRAKSLSSPSILATDNMEARIQVGDSIPTLSSSGFSPSANNVIFNTVQNVDTGVILSVTPHISATGMVSMRINQEVSSPIAAPAGVPNISPSINRSTAATTLTVRDGDTIAIAGIITEAKTLGRTRVPVLGDIPILGAAFGNTSYTNKRSELIIFITPHVVTNLDQQKVVTEGLRKEMKKLKNDLRNNDRARQKAWGTPAAVVPPAPKTNPTGQPGKLGVEP
ncbi:MAG: type II secretion system secretin GspD [Acidobacteriia bacterium]|nr:type II secretion system secretin GspD [Terriglobia bacterium]